jgi:RNA polymerase sigma-70 factor (ECF subfamily)
MKAIIVRSSREAAIPAVDVRRRDEYNRIRRLVAESGRRRDFVGGGSAVELALTQTPEQAVADPALAGAEFPESELMGRARDGDREAFGLLVERYMRRAYYAALGLIGSPDDALDLSQDAFVRAFRARRTLDPSRPFYPWLYQIVRRLCFNMVRDRRTRCERISDARSWLVEQSENRHAGLDPRRAFEADETRQRVQKAIAALAPNDREVLVLKEFEGLRYREIADLVGIPIGTVMSRLYTARRRLASALEEGR